MTDLIAIPFTQLELESAKELLYKISPLEPLSEEQYSYYGENQIYDRSFDGGSMKNGVYYGCKFVKANFHGTAGNNSVMEDCSFEKCSLKNANFKYSKFANSMLSIHSSASSYDFSDFSDTTIINSKIEGSSFSECFFWNSKIENSEIKYCEFKNSSFHDCIFNDIDLSNVTFDYSEFMKPRFHNVILPFWSILNIVSGFEQIMAQDDISFKLPNSEHIINCHNYIDNIRLLKPILYQRNSFLALANTYIYDGELQNAYDAVMKGLQYSCKIKDFSTIRHLCKFASINQFFRMEQLKEFYTVLDNNIDISTLGYAEYQNYINELYLAKQLLIDCPFNRDIIRININTQFCYKDSLKLAQTYDLINSTLEQYAPDANNHIVLRHNSPPEIEIILSGDIEIIVAAYFALQLVFFNTLQGIEKIQNIIKNREDRKVRKIETEIKKIELDNIKSKIRRSEILLPEDFKDISYMVKTSTDLPKDLWRLKNSMK